MLYYKTMSEYLGVSAEPPHDAIRICPGCPLGDLENPGSERYIVPTPVFKMGFDQAGAAPEDRLGYPEVRVRMEELRYGVGDLCDGSPPISYAGFLPVRSKEQSPLEDIALTPEQWTALQPAGCTEGPSEGSKRYVIVGPREVGCSLLKLLQQR